MVGFHFMYTLFVVFDLELICAEVIHARWLHVAHR